MELCTIDYDSLIKFLTIIKYFIIDKIEIIATIR